MADVSVGGIDSDDRVCIITIDDGVAAVFTEEIDGVVDIEGFLVGASVDDDSVAVGCIVECCLYGGIGFIRADIECWGCVCTGYRRREWCK